MQGNGSKAEIGCLFPDGKNVIFQIIIVTRIMLICNLLPHTLIFWIIIVSQPAIIFQFHDFESILVLYYLIFSGTNMILQNLLKYTNFSFWNTGKRLAVGYSNGDIHVIDLGSAETKHIISSHESHKGTVTSIDCHLTNKVIISAGRDGKTIVNPVGEKTVHNW